MSFQREAIEAAGHFIPMVVENVRGAQPWVGRARWNFGSYYLWGDVPALMPITHRLVKGRSNFHFHQQTGLPSPSFHVAVCNRTLWLDLVDRSEHRFACKIEREFTGESDCGPGGKWFDPKP